MLSELDYTINRIEEKENVTEFTFSFSYLGRVVEISRIVENGLPEKVKLVDSLINDALFGKLTFEDFLTTINIMMDVKNAEDLYYYCVDLNEKFTYLFGDYEKKWMGEFDNLTI